MFMQGVTLTDVERTPPVLGDLKITGSSPGSSPVHNVCRLTQLCEDSHTVCVSYVYHTLCVSILPVYHTLILYYICLFVAV